MTPIDHFLLSLHQQGIKLWLDEQKQLHFKAPSGALTPVLQGELKARKIEIIDYLRKIQTDTALPQTTPDLDNRFIPFPLTDIQEAYWLGHHESFDLNAPSHFYEEIACCGLDCTRLEDAWQQLVKRHDMLRVIILPTGKQQILAELPPWTINSYDLTDANEGNINQHLETIRQEMFTRSFPPDQWPLFDIRFTRLPLQEIRIHFCLDMLVVDWGSCEILLREWAAIYHHPEKPLLPLTFSFRDYVLAERKIRETDLYERATHYWQQRLSSLPSAPQLPLAMEPDALKTPQFKRHQTLIDKNNWSLLKIQSSRLGLTPTCLLITIFSEILTRWSKHPQFTLNLTFFNRLPLFEQMQVDQIVGDFTSLTMLAIDNSDMSENLVKKGKRLQNQLWQDLDNRYFSGVQVLRALSVQQNESGPILMPVIFTSGLGVLEKGGNWLGQTVYGISQTPQVWLDCQVEENDGHLRLIWDVVEALFPPGLIATMFAAYHTLLLELVGNEDKWHVPAPDLLPVNQLQKRQQINNTKAPVSNELLHTLFIKQAVANPKLPAVFTQERNVSYGELYHEATKVAHWLRANGACPNQLVAVIMEKGWEQVVAVLGILISGAAYFPVDPELPRERKKYLLDQTRVELVLTQPHLENQYVYPNSIKLFTVTKEYVSAALDLPEPLICHQNSTDLAYVIYTSGSTGQPKGVMIDHRGAVNTILDINQRFDVTAQDRVLALSALNFDLSVYDIFGLLAIGGAIVIPSREERRNPDHWVDLVNKHCVSLWNTVPALAQMLVESLTVRSLDSPLRLIMMSGDWIPLDLAARIRQIMPETMLMCLGGATEASIWSICYPITAINPAWKSIPYGKPLNNQRFHVLSPRLEPCPDWVVGQLYIGGIGLALGYWEDEEKSKDSFFIHPTTGERLYKTGDTGRYLPDGNIEFLGRDDFQIKIRGHRIELGEIEANLLRHPLIKEAIVSTVGEERHRKQLAAYIVLRESITRQDDIRDVDQATYGLQAMQGVITDPIERLQFKLDQPGLRHFEITRTAVILPPVDISNESYLVRQSYRRYLTEPIPLRQISQLLACLGSRSFPDGVLPKYQYASAGSLYPVQTYLYIKPEYVVDLAGGFYYYDPMNHKLVLLSSNTHVLNRELHSGTNQVIFDQSAFSIFLVGEYQAIEPMYGASARDFSLLEAGYMSQLLMMKAPTYNLGLCPVGGMQTEPLHAECGLSRSQEVLHSLLGGGIASEHTLQLNQAVPQTESLEESLKVFLSQKLPDYMIPAIYVQLGQLPLTANGKIDRKALVATPLRSSCIKPEKAMPRDALELQLLLMWESVLDIHPLSIHDNIFESGGNSLLVFRLVNHIRRQYPELTVSSLFQYPTVSALAQYLRTDCKPQSIEFIAMNKSDNTSLVYCLPGVPGSVMYLYPLASCLGQQHTIYALQTPGLDGSTTPGSNEELARFHLQALLLKQPTGPYQLIGHCAGAKVAFELAWQLEQQGQTIALLAILDDNAPDSNPPNAYADFTDIDWLLDFIQAFEKVTEISLNLSLQQLQALSNLETAYNLVMQSFQQQEVWFAPKASVDELKAMVKNHRITMLAYFNYKIPGKLRCPIHLFRSIEQPLPSEFEDNREAWGWAEGTLSQVIEHWAPGTHDSMVTHPHVKDLAKDLLNYLQ